MRLTLTLGWFTLRDLSRQGYTLVIVAAAAAWIAFSQFLPMFLDEEAELRLVLDIGLATILLATLALALLPAGSSLGDEIESRTALTLLSKPLSRAQFFHGKFLGILGTVAWAAVLLGGVLLWTVHGKRAAIDPDVAAPWFDRDVAGGVLLIATQASLLTVLALALSNVLPLIPNLCVCVLLTAAGYLSDRLAPALFGEEAVSRGATLSEQWADSPGVCLVETVRGALPNFSLFNLNDAIAAGTPIPPRYVAWSLAYSLALGAAYLSLGTWMFERRDIR